MNFATTTVYYWGPIKPWDEKVLTNILDDPVKTDVFVKSLQSLYSRAKKVMFPVYDYIIDYINDTYGKPYAFDTALMISRLHNREWKTVGKPGKKGPSEFGNQSSYVEPKLAHLIHEYLENPSLNSLRKKEEYPEIIYSDRYPGAIDNEYTPEVLIMMDYIQNNIVPHFYRDIYPVDVTIEKIKEEKLQKDFFVDISSNYMDDFNDYDADSDEEDDDDEDDGDIYENMQRLITKIDTLIYIANSVGGFREFLINTLEPRQNKKGKIFIEMLYPDESPYFAIRRRKKSGYRRKSKRRSRSGRKKKGSPKKSPKRSSRKRKSPKRVKKSR